MFLKGFLQIIKFQQNFSTRKAGQRERESRLAMGVIVISLIFSRFSVSIILKKSNLWPRFKLTLLQYGQIYQSNFVWGVTNLIIIWFQDAYSLSSLTIWAVHVHGDWWLGVRAQGRTGAPPWCWPSPSPSSPTRPSCSRSWAASGPSTAFRLMPGLVQQLLTDAKRLSNRLMDHDQSADTLISRCDLWQLTFYCS